MEEAELELDPVDCYADVDNDGPYVLGLDPMWQVRKDKLTILHNNITT